MTTKKLSEFDPVNTVLDTDLIFMARMTEPTLAIRNKKATAQDLITYINTKIPTDTSPVVFDKGIGMGTQTFAYGAGQYQILTISGPTTILFSGWSAAPYLGKLRLKIVTTGTAYPITWPIINWIKGDGSTTTSFVASGIIIPATGVSFFDVWTDDSGQTVYGMAVR